MECSDSVGMQRGAPLRSSRCYGLHPVLDNPVMSPGASHGARAWLVRWEWVGAHAAVEQPVAAILPWRWGHVRVLGVVECLYAAREFDPVDMLEASRPGGNNPYPAHLGTCRAIREDGTTSQVEWQGEVLCGHNPHLVARQARVWRDGGATGSVCWEDLPRPGY
jgi:hypothetical protein